MARLRDGDKQDHTNRIHRIVRGHALGLTEAELARMVGMERRRLNNYLRSLAAQDKVYREGRLWYAG